MKINYASLGNDRNIYEGYYFINNLIENFDLNDNNEDNQVVVNLINENLKEEIKVLTEFQIDDEVYAIIKYDNPFTTFEKVIDEFGTNDVFTLLNDNELPTKQNRIYNITFNKLKNKLDDIKSWESMRLILLSQSNYSILTEPEKSAPELGGNSIDITYNENSGILDNENSGILDNENAIEPQGTYSVILVKLKPLQLSLNSSTLTIEKGNNLILKDDDYTSNGTVIYERDTTISTGYNLSMNITSKNFSDYKLERNVNLLKENTINRNKVGTYNVKDLNDNDIVVKVIDTTPPQISIIGDKNIKLERGTRYTDRGAEADGGETIKVETELTKDENGKYIIDNVGEFKIKYMAYDEEGNVGSDERIITSEDTIGPEIILRGSRNINHEKGTKFTDEGAYATDGEEVTKSGNVNINKIGEYKLTYTAKDRYNNVSTSQRIINVIDTTPPVLNVEGEESITLERKSNYNELGAYTRDNDVDDEIEIENRVNLGKVGDYFVIYTVSDKSGNEGEVKRRVKVIDTTLPNLILNGQQEMTIEHRGDNFVDPGAYVENEPTINVTTYGTIDVNEIGDQELKYVAIDKSGNRSEKTRIVNVEDTTAPRLSLYGEDQIELEKGQDDYIEKNVRAHHPDNELEIKVSGEVDTSKVGDYKITYSAEDEHGNKGVVERSISVVDTSSPTINVDGGDVTIEKNTPYYDRGAKIEGDDENLSIISSGNVDISKVGTYVITYIATDEHMNIGTATRRVKVIDTIEPIIELIGDNYIQHERYQPYKDQGAICKDDDEELPDSNITVESSVDINKIGKYHVTYIAKDNAGNLKQAIREVEVIDSEAPVIILESFIIEGLDQNTFPDDYVERGNNYTIPKFTTDTGDAVTRTIKYINDDGEEMNVDRIDTTLTGTYEINLESVDEGNNIGRALKKVIVRDTTNPEIKLIGDSEVTIERGNEYEDPGAEYSDNNMPLDNSKFKTESNLNIHVQGKYSISYIVTDNSGLQSSVVRTVNVEDTISPVIKLKGANPITIEKGSNYEELGAHVENEPEIEVTSSGIINTNVNGLYIIKYKARDSHGNESEAEREVIVSDQTAPTIRLVGEESVSIEKGSVYTDQGARVLGPESLNKESNVNVNKVGKYFVIYSAIDSDGNKATSKRVVNVIDTTPPTLNLIGDYETRIEKGSEYIEKGAVSDSTKRIEISGEVDTNRLGTHVVKYLVEDSNGNKSETSRNISVVDTINPIVTLNGPSKIQIQKDQTYYDIGAKSDTGEEVTVESDVDTSKTGSYNIRYKSVDASGNEGYANRIVEVIDTIAPIIKIKGDNPKTIYKNDVYLDEGVIVKDKEKATTTNNVDTNKIGTYFVSYKLIDDSGNESSAVRVVNVINDPNKVVTIPLDEILMEEEGGGVTLYVIILIVLVIAIILFFYYN